MGTRGLTMVVSNKETKVAQYGQWDHYPSGQGRTALEILTKIMTEGKLEEFREKVNNLKWLTDEQIVEINNLDIPFKEHQYLSRDWGAQILEAVMYNTLTKEKGFMQPETKVIPIKILGLINNEKFAKNSLFCEWAYVVDLDKMTFEVYEGYNETRLNENERFAYLAKEIDAEFHPVRHIKTYDLNNLPTVEEFLTEWEKYNEDKDNE